MPPWYGDHAELVSFGALLIEVGEFTTVKDLQYFYEKPHKWNNEHESWVANGRCEKSGDPGWVKWYTELEER